MSTYKYGSAAHAHNNSQLVIPRLQWLGLLVTDAIAGVNSVEDGVLLSLTARDRKKTVSMLRNSPVLARNGPELGWRVELQRMLMLNIKAEIEILYEQEKGLEGWIDQEMSRQGN
jgi:meiotic recombination protein SPO11